MSNIYFVTAFVTAALIFFDYVSNRYNWDFGAMFSIVIGFMYMSFLLTGTFSNDGAGTPEGTERVTSWGFSFIGMMLVTITYICIVPREKAHDDEVE